MFFVNSRSVGSANRPVADQLGVQPLGEGVGICARWRYWPFSWRSFSTTSRGNVSGSVSSVDASSGIGSSGVDLKQVPRLLRRSFGHGASSGRVFEFRLPRPPKGG